MFNSRLQPVQIALGSTGTGAQAHDLLKLDYGYGGANNNGNVLSQTITVPSATIGGTTHNGFTAVQNYAYDSLNRLDDAAEYIAGNQTWRQDFSYDRYGNRSFVEANTTFEGFDKLCANNTELCAELRKVLNPSANASDNRLSTSDGYVFDTSGNTVRDPQSRRFTYDGENKQVKVETLDLNGNPVSTVGEYIYDGDGRRIKKHVPSTGEVTVFVYDAGGKLIGEYSTIAAPESPKVSYTTQDHLGSPRILTDQNGATISRRDFHPFGEQVARTGYGSDEVRKQFTGYERDGETGLDFAQARMYGAGHGRFSTPDDFKYSKSIEPQSWNLYLYTGNNPMNRVDPTGHDWFLVNGKAQWQKGKKYSYETTAADGSKTRVEAKNLGVYLVTYEMYKNSDDPNAKGAAVGKLTLWKQNKAVATNEFAYSGGSETGCISCGNGAPIPVGKYWINLTVRGRATEADLNQDGELKPHYGLQEIPKTGRVGPNQYGWGSRRIRLNSENSNRTFQGNYIHGQREDHGPTTAGCIADRGNTVINEIFKITPSMHTQNSIRVEVGWDPNNKNKYDGDL